MTLEESGKINQLKRALQPTSYFVVDKSTEKENVLLLYHKTPGGNYLVKKRSDVKRFISDVKKITGIKTETIKQQSTTPFIQPSPPPGGYWWNKD